MKFKANSFEILNSINGTKLMLTVDKEYIKTVNKMQDNIALKSDLEVEINKFYTKRKKGHNSLFWDMCNYLSDYINIPADDIYRKIILESGVSTIYPVQDEILEMVISDWENRGLGWQTEKLRKSKLDGNYTNVKFWFGSSVYNSKQMYRIVENLKQECAVQNLDITFYDSQMTSLLSDLERKENEKHNTTV